MIRYAIPLLATCAVSASVNAAEVTIAATGPVIELTVMESVKARPDIATVSAGVTTQAPTAVAAMRDNAAAMNKVVARIKQLGIAEDDIQSTGISLGAQYDYDQARQRQVFRGYQASNRVSVILRDIAKTGEVLDALVAAGATDLGGPDWAIDNDKEARAQARKAAMEAARAQALDYARMAGYGDIRLLEINETVTQHMPMPMLRTVSVQAEAATPVEPGLVQADVSITVKYEMTR